MKCIHIIGVSVVSAALAFAATAAAQETTKAEAKNMRLVGYSDLQARTAY